jgi:hypothetical protein
MTEEPVRDAWVELVPREEIARRLAAAPPGSVLYDFGFVHNMSRLMRTHPRLAATWGPHVLAVMGEDGALTRSEKELVAAVAAAAQDCHY